MVIAVPFGTIAALFITEYASPKLRRYLTGLVDLLAAIPSLHLRHLGLPLPVGPDRAALAVAHATTSGGSRSSHTDPGASLTGSMFIAGIVVALMVVPIITSVVREVFAQTPPGEKEAALALGSTRWGMIRAVVLPYGSGGIVGGAMLGLGRALGETIAVALLLPTGAAGQRRRSCRTAAPPSRASSPQRAGGDTFTVSGLMAAGLVLFVLTLGTNMIASVVVARSRSGAGVEL